MPFEKRVVVPQGGTGYTNVLANIIWIIFGGLYAAINHLFWAILFTLTIVGIPFAKQHLKALKISLTPFGIRLTYE